MHLIVWNSPSGGGIWAGQHYKHKAGQFDIDDRAAFASAVRVIDRQDKGGESNLGHWKEDPETRGIVEGLMCWPRGKRVVAGWGFAIPAVMDDYSAPSLGVTTSSGVRKDSGGVATGGGKCSVLSQQNMIPVQKEDMVADKDYASLTPERPKRGGKDVWNKFPKNWYGIGIMGSETNRQVDYFMPTDPRCIAMQFEGDPETGTLMVDVDGNNEVAYDRTARLQSKNWILKKPTYCGAMAEYNVIAWNIGPTKCDDTRGGYVIDRRGCGGENDVPTPGGGGGGGAGDPVATLDVAGILNGKIAAMAPGVAAGTLFGGAMENLQLALNILNGGGAAGAAAIIAGAGGAGAGAGAAGFGPPPPIMPKTFVSSAGKGIIALVSIADSGFLDVGDAGDKHHIGNDADGRPINSAHISTAANFKEPCSFRDAPLEFGTAYIDPERGSYLVPTYLRYDPRPSHAHVCGPQKGLWRWESECCVTKVDPPMVPTQVFMPPPPVATGGAGPGGPAGGGGSGGGGGGRVGFPTFRPWELGRADGMSATNLTIAMPGIILRPQDPSSGAYDLRYPIGLIPPVLVKQIDKQLPVTGRIEAFGAITKGEWAYTQKPNKGRFQGGTAPGGMVLIPPELDIADIATSFVRADLTTSPTYFVGVPGTYFAGGIPDLSTGRVKTGYRHGVDTTGKWSLDQLNASATISNVLSANGGTSGVLIGRRPLSGDSFTFVGVTAVSTTSTAYSGGGALQTIRSATLPADFMTDVSGQQIRRGIRVKAWGICAANGNAKALQLDFGATTVALNDISTNPNGENWELDAMILQTATANVQEAVGESVVGYTQQTKQRTAPGETTSGTIAVAVKATCAANGDVTIKGFMLEVLN